MTVYVDSLMNHGWVIFCKTVPSCHLIADSVTELNAFAIRIGLKARYIQLHSVPHYDLTARRRNKAIELGAVPLNRRQFVERIRKLRDDRMYAM